MLVGTDDRLARFGDNLGEFALDGIVEAHIGGGKLRSSSRSVVLRVLPSERALLNGGLSLLGLVDVLCLLLFLVLGDHETPLLCSPALTIASIKSAAVNCTPDGSAPTSRSRHPLRSKILN